MYTYAFKLMAPLMPRVIHSVLDDATHNKYFNNGYMMVMMAVELLICTFCSSYEHSYYILHMHTN